ncbi:magnesium/cobalt transporter CorA [Mucilaginibacter sp. RS28]|uniref:Magnesium transport protein CorA n=1 Tax=Mucilaginibacter straminoryzae TaxID=2932774 RepID=A0A9X1X6B7_9SPHI|nr:magnesium/cobalt transporter CorA [Mucilaginibacter straminoryzae]MCJ8211145.1 magnesium/cobalt transporter CorA [Mucilaginibacter straminoryzae]
MSRKRYRFKPKAIGLVGDSPGMVRIPEDAHKPHIQVFSYNTKEVVASKGEAFSVIMKHLETCTEHTHWIKVNGLGDAELFQQIADILKINPLVLEDITNTRQRPKFDEYDGYVFATSRVIKFNEEHELTNQQFSAIVKDNLLISFEEDYSTCFEPVIERLKSGKGSIRTGGSGYMCYALMDTIIDEYFVVLADIGETLDTIEDRVYESPDKRIMYETQHIKRELIMMRRVSWPERDKINDMIRSDSPLVTPEVKTFLRDAYDHCIQIMDMTDSYKEITGNVMDLYLSMVSNRMNEIMKVLTIISVIFIPLTFIAGVYGMNFSRQDEKGRPIPDNMPELYAHHGYVYTIGIMLLIGIIQVIIFWRKGWFNRL